jgi:hypothetical protein
MPALTSSAGLAVLFYHGNKQVILVPWSKSENRDDQA